MVQKFYNKTFVGVLLYVRVIENTRGHSMLTVTNLACARNEKFLFTRVSFTVTSGQVLHIVGSNGIGKTTLLRTIAGLFPPSCGQIIVDKANICYVGHKSGLHPDLTVLQNLQFLQGLMDETKVAKNILQTLEYFDIGTSANKKIADLSAGFVQKVSLARLLLSTAKIWLLDEPLAHLDQNAGKSLERLCCDHLQNKGVIVFASHNDFNITKEYDAQTFKLNAA